MDPEQNPEKIPLNPIEEERAALQYPVAAGNQDQPDNPAQMAQRLKLAKLDQPAFSSRQKFLLIALVIVLIVVAIITGLWLFGDELGL